MRLTNRNKLDPIPKSESLITVAVVGQQAKLVSNAESQRTWKMVRFRYQFPGLAPDTCIQNIKEMLSMCVGLAPYDQKIFKNGLQIKNTDTLQSAGIRDNDVLQLEKRRLGSLAPIARRRRNIVPKVRAHTQSYQSMRLGGMWGAVRVADGASAIDMWKRRMEQAAAQKMKPLKLCDTDRELTFLCNRIRKKRMAERLEQRECIEAQLMREWARAFCFEIPVPDLTSSTVADVVKPRSNRRVIRRRQSGWSDPNRWSTPAWVPAAQALGKFFRWNRGLTRWTGRTLLRFYNPKTIDSDSLTRAQKKEEEMSIRREAMQILHARRVDE